LWGEIATIRKLIREEGIDVVQVHGPTNPHAAIAARLERVPVVWQLYEMRTPMVARRATMPIVLRLADVLMTTGLEVARLHPGALRARDRLVTFVPPVDSDRFRPDEDTRAAARAELGIPPGSLAFGTLGNLNPDKGHEFLLRAAGKVLARRPDATLRVLGSRSPAHASYEAALRRDAEKLGPAVRFVDPGDRAAELLPGLDLFVLASRREGIPTVVLEAMACGLPVITTDVGAVREVARHGHTALVVPPCDPEALASAVLELLGDADRRRAFGAAGRQAMVERFDVDRCADAHETAYRMALGIGPAGAPSEPVGAAR
jgi:glycosyltransferase involved in cell wall biosynthesis